MILISYSLISPDLPAQETQHQSEPAEESDTLPEVEITDAGPGVMIGLTGVPAISTKPGQNCSQHVSELAISLPGTTIRQRGIHGVQGDVSIRGSAPEQVQVLLNDIPVNDPQTGHHNLNIPIPLISLSKVKKHTPATAQQPGCNAFSGSLNFINNIPDETTFRVWLTAGQHKLIDVSAAADFQTSKTKHHIAFRHSSSDGHSKNTDFRQIKVYLNNYLAIAPKISADVQLGHNQNAFGAEGFYSDKYPTQFENIKTNIFSAKIRKTGKINLNTSLYFRQNTDRFELFRETVYNYHNGYFINDKDTAKFVAGVYEPWNYYSGHNYHKTCVTGYRLYASGKMKYGIIKTGIHHRHELILSNVLGKPRFDAGEQENAQYTHQAIRDHINAAATWQSPEMSGFIAGLTGLMHYTKTYGTLFYGGTRMQYRIKSNISIWAGANQNMRLPSFTDLYYDGPSNKGNPDLLPEQATNLELGFYSRFGNITMQNQAFYQLGKNMIDWVKPTPGDVYTTRNYTRLNTYGNEFSLDVDLNKNTYLYPWVKNIRCHYTWMRKHKPEIDMISAYALDYLKHQAGFSVNQQIPGTGLSLLWTIHFNDRAGTYTQNHKEYQYKPWYRTDIKLNYKIKSFVFYISAYNLFDADIREFGNITLPGRWIKTGIKIKIRTPGPGPVTEFLILNE
ncbi:MAG: TonB-dependent receptor [Bacteroidales bacterium]